MSIPPAPISPPNETPAAPSPFAAESASTQSKNTPALVALILAIVGALFAVIPATNGFSWLILLAAFIVAIVGLTRKGKKKGMAVAALIVSVVFWIVSIFVGIGVIATGVSEAIDEEDAPPAVSEPVETEAAAPPAEEEEAEAVVEEPAEDTAGIGSTVVTDNGVSITLSSVDYGVAPPNDFIVDEVRGELAAVSMSMTNGSNDTVSLSSSSVLGYIGDAQYEAAGLFGSDGAWYVFEDINPGLTVTFTAYIDVPPGTPLDSVEYLTALFLGESAVFATN